MTIALSDPNLWNKINELFGTKCDIYKIKAFNDNLPVQVEYKLPLTSVLCKRG